MKKVFIIAEAGVNHNGDLSLAKKLIDVAVDSGADAVKFQTFITEHGISKDAPKAQYQIQSGDLSESHYDMVKKLELDAAAHNDLVKYCIQKDIMFMSTPFDLASIDLLHDLQLEIFKIPSSEIVNLPYLRKIGKLNKKVILSTGMSTMKEIGDALNILVNSGTEKSRISVLHVNSEYPTPMEDVNLRAMLSIASEFGVDIGYSDHTLGIEVPVAAVALGATIIEKHFTLDKTFEGPDHRASLEPVELSLMVKSIRNIEIALGSRNKIPSPSETKNIPIARKSIVAACEIKDGDVFTEDNLAIKRPGSGLSPMLWDSVIGNISKNKYKQDEKIELTEI
jgi:N,N'-diacetyllegionaminate synthase